ncbi:MAG: GTP cyclohydrolase I FolE [Flavobacteriales bacterium]|nr:GTP cyclohydrolase I FolE [Flavobacteriales bacterium]MCB9196136.1 GTP cyclohydrolase I FolE [Flavobacteriales bacterium]
MNKEEKIIAMGEDHYSSSLDNPMKKDAFAMSDEEKIKKIAEHFEAIMDIMGMDLKDDSLAGTPSRVAKMYIQEIFSGLNPSNEPAVSLFENNYKYDGMLVEKDIELYSLCEHHFVPIVGKVHVAYFAKDHVIGLSKINRIVQYYAKRPQVQERMTMQIVAKLQEVLKTEDVACVIDAKHFCVSMRGVKDSRSTTVTSQFKGKFAEENFKSEFLKHISLELKIDGLS